MSRRRRRPRAVCSSLAHHSPNSPSANLGCGERGCCRQHAAVSAPCMTCPPRSSHIEVLDRVREPCILRDSSAVKCLMLSISDVCMQGQWEVQGHGGRLKG